MRAFFYCWHTLTMAKLNVSDVKKGKILKIEDKLYKVVDTSHTHMGRGGATYSFKVKDILLGKTNTFTYQNSAILEEAEVQTNNGMFLYSAGENYSFMENDTWEMYDLHEDDVSEVSDYLKENMDVYLMKYEGNVINVLLPNTVSYVIKSTVPGIKGDRAQAGKKPATLETWLEIMVPLHKEEGDTVIVNTVTGETI